MLINDQRLKDFNIFTVEVDVCSEAQGTNLTPCLLGIHILTVFLQLILSFDGKVIDGALLLHWQGMDFNCRLKQIKLTRIIVGN